jgi:hypothetical protein
MLSDMVGRRSFHRHIITSGGRTARPATTAQSVSDRKLPAIPAVQTAETQTAVTMVLMESSCILKVYGPALNGAVPECTCKPRSNHQGPSGRRAGALMRCAIENSGQQLCWLQFWHGGMEPVEHYMLLILGAVIASIAVVIIPRTRVRDGLNGAHLGWMSEQWLAEHRASH